MCCRRVILVWAIVFLSVCASSCSIGPIPPPLEKTFLPGECLRSPALIFSRFHLYEGKYRTDGTRQTFFVFSFAMDMKCVYSPAPPRGVDRYLPTDDVFNAFEGSCPNIKELYEEVWQEVTDSKAGNCFSSSIFYDSGISLTADKEFAGFPTGDNIASNVSSSDRDETSILFYGPCHAYYHTIPVGDSFTYNCYLPQAFELRIPINDFDIVDEDITFNLSIPVKVGLYLTWLSNKLSDPDTPFPYREEILTCTFTANKGLHHK